MQRNLYSYFHPRHLVTCLLNFEIVIKLHFNSSEWALCGSFSSRASILSRSTFTLVPSSDKLDLLISTSLLTARIGEALRSGAIPVIIGRKEMLPFSEYIEWEKAALFIPQVRNGIYRD